MIDVRNLTFDYPGHRALDDVSFRLPAGSVTALVGPNGAGKTTLLRCLAALEEPLSGTVTINGIATHEKPREVHRQLGYLSDFFGLHEALTVRQSLLHSAALQGIPGRREEAEAARAADRLGLSGKLDDRVSTLSRGQRQRLAIAQAVVHEPKVLLLDEPAAGLDPEARHAMADLFLALRDGGMTLLVSSHILAELEEYSSAMLAIRDGRIVSHHGIVEAEAAVRIVATLAAPVEGIAERIAGLEGLSSPEFSDREVAFLFSGDEAGRHRLLAEMIARGLPVCGFAAGRRTMQDAYLSTIREGRP